jgi:hypothetical protein
MYSIEIRPFLRKNFLIFLLWILRKPVLVSVLTQRYKHRADNCVLGPIGSRQMVGSDETDFGEISGSYGDGCEDDRWVLSAHSGTSRHVSSCVCRSHRKHSLQMHAVCTAPRGSVCALTAV